MSLTGSRRSALATILLALAASTLPSAPGAAPQDAARNPPILVIGATNAPWQLDAALRRPGRFDQAIFVPPPDPAARGW